MKRKINIGPPGWPVLNCITTDQHHTIKHLCGKLKSVFPYKIQQLLFLLHLYETVKNFDKLKYEFQFPTNVYYIFLLGVQKLRNF